MPRSLLPFGTDVGPNAALDTYGDIDTLLSIERVRGSPNADYIYGNNGDNEFAGLAGDDFIDGNGGYDIVRYEDDANYGGNEGVFVNLSDLDYSVSESVASSYSLEGSFVIEAGTASDGFGDQDTLGQHRRGARHRQRRHLGRSQRHEQQRRDHWHGGNDYLVGLGVGYMVGGPGADTFDGTDVVQSDGFDIVDYGRESGSSGVAVNLAGAPVSNPFSAVPLAPGTAWDTFGDIRHADRHRIRSSAASATISSMAEARTKVWRAWPATTTWTAAEAPTKFVTTTTSTGAHPHRVSPSTLPRIRRPTASAITTRSITSRISAATLFADTLTGDGQNNRFRSLAGSDIIDGGGGTDTVDYRRDADFGGDYGVIVNLSGSDYLVGSDVAGEYGMAGAFPVIAHTARDGFGDTDFLTSIERVQGTESDDILIGDDGDNNLQGFGGDDLIIGNGGNDSLDGGAGDDTVQGGAGDDYIRGTAGAADLADGGQDFDVLGFGGETGTITVTLNTGQTGAGQITGTIGGAGVHTDFTNMERVEGTDGGDHFTAGEGVGVSNEFGEFEFVGEAGDDQFTDTSTNRVVTVNYDAEKFSHDGFDGIWGDDADESGVVVNLSSSAQGGVASGTATDTFGNVDTLTGIRSLRLTDASDTFWAGDTGVYVDGKSGDDTLTGGAGNDQLRGGAGNDTDRWCRRRGSSSRRRRRRHPDRRRIE